MSRANVVVLMAAAAQPIVATSVAKRQMQRRRVLKDQLGESSSILSVFFALLGIRQIV